MKREILKYLTALFIFFFISVHGNDKNNHLTGLMWFEVSQYAALGVHTGNF